MTSYIDDYGTCEDTNVSLVLHHIERDPAEVTLALGIQPSESSMAQPAAEVAPNYRRRPASWSCSSTGWVKSRDARRHLDWLLTQLGGKGPMLDDLRQLGWRTDVWCFWVSAAGHGGPMFSADELSTLGELGLGLSFDLYFSVDDENADDDSHEPPANSNQPAG